MNLELCKQEKFNGMDIDLYKNNNNEIFMTREQIGKALEYLNPQKSIDKIHQRNKERLDKFSSTVKLGVELKDGRKQERELVLYTCRGVYEICRYSKQPKANEFYDWVYDVLEEIRNTGMYTVPKYRLPSNYKEAVKALLEEIESHEKTQQKLEELAPKAEFADVITEAETNLPIGTFAKIVYRKTGMGRNKLFEWLRHHEYLMNIPSEYNKPTQKAINLGILTSSERISKDNLLVNVSVTPKGQLYIYRKLANYKENHSLLLGNKAKMIMA